MALTMLEYGMESQAGFTVVTGEIGAGKTPLIRKLLQRRRALKLAMRHVRRRTCP